MPRLWRAGLSKRSLDEMIAARGGRPPYSATTPTSGCGSRLRSQASVMAVAGGIMAEGRPAGTSNVGDGLDAFGDKFDIMARHRTGVPAHENELRSLLRVSFDAWEVRMTTASCQLEREKMSKSARQLLHEPRCWPIWPGEGTRMRMLKTPLPLALDRNTKGGRRKSEDARRLYAGAARRGRSAIAGHDRSAVMTSNGAGVAVCGCAKRAEAGGRAERGEFAARSGCSASLSMSAADWRGRKQQASGVDQHQVDA